MSETEFPIEGSCQCGRVRYKLLKKPDTMYACHCKACQKLSTSAFSITAFVKAEDFEVEGEMNEWGRLADSGNKNHAKFCPTCGNRIYHFNPDKPEMIKLKPASMDDTSWIKPSAHIWLCEKQDWFEAPKDTPQYDKQP